MSGCVKRDKEKSQPIQVFIRPRPLNRQESDLRTGACIEVVGSKDITVKQQYGKRYTFDKVFNLSSHQIDVYKTVVKPLIPEVIAGYNCTVFAYGQTGTGKTYTMAGGSPSSVSSWHNDPEAGIIPRAMAHLFDELCVIPQQYTVRVSYIELYNEELFDLLSDNVENKNIRLFEDHQQKGSVIINGASTETVYNKNEVYNILLKGQEKRRTASTLLNAQSSRSHTVFIIMVHTCETTVEGEQLVKTGKLNLVDLAGSENINRSGAVDRRAREAGNINQSLLTLGRVIKALVEKTAHIPYRESKLTRILQDSLGGRTKTSIIATISPSLTCLEETLSTLDYAHRAKYITNRPEINQRVSEKAWKAQYEKEMDQLRKDLHAARTGTGVYLDTENYHRLITDSENFKEELSEKSSHNIQLELQIQNLEQQKEMKESEWNAIRISFDATKNELRHCKDMLEKNSYERKEQEFLADYYKLKVDSLYTQAKYLLDETDATTKRHQETLKRLYSTSQENNLLATEIIDKVAKKSSEIVDDLMKFILKIRDIYECLDDIVTHSQNSQEKEYERIKVTKEQMLSKIGVFVNTIECNLEEALSEDYKKQKSFLHRIEGKLETVKNLCKGLDIKLDLKIIQSKVLTEINSVKDNCKEQDEVNECIMSSITRMESDINTIKNLIKRSQYLSGSSKDSLIKMEKVSTTISDKANVIGKEANSTVQELSEIMKIIEESGHQDMKTNTILSEISKCKLGLETINNSTNMKLKEKIKDIIERVGEDINSNENESNINIISKTSAICKKANCTIQLLSETMEMIEESRNQDTSTNSVLSGTNICKPNSESRNNSINMELNQQIKDIIEIEVQDINCSKNQFLTYTSQNNKMKKCFTEVEDTLENVEFLEKIQECRSELENLRSNGLKDITVSTTPIRPSSRLNLAAPSPRERILSRFQNKMEQTPNKTFGLAEEVNTDCQILTENGCSDHTNGSSILNNQRNEFRHKNKMSELDKENNEA